MAYSVIHTPGDVTTRTASATITAGQLVAVSGANTVGPAAADSTAVLGVAQNDAVSGGYVTVVKRGVFNLLAAGTGISAGDRVKAGAAGTVVEHVIGTDPAERCIGIALSAITNATTGPVELF